MFLKNRNIVSKMKRSKVTDYAALTKGLKYKVNTLMSAQLSSGTKALIFCLESSSTYILCVSEKQ